jgi:hypothetical protein
VKPWERSYDVTVQGGVLISLFLSFDAAANTQAQAGGGNGAATATDTAAQSEDDGQEGEQEGELSLEQLAKNPALWLRHKLKMAQFGVSV